MKTLDRYLWLFGTETSAVLYDAGVTVEGRPYLALEYVDGQPIDAYCKGRDLESILRLVVQVARAVAYAHGQLVIHRDPSDLDREYFKYRPQALFS